MDYESFLDRIEDGESKEDLKQELGIQDNGLSKVVSNLRSEGYEILETGGRIYLRSKPDSVGSTSVNHVEETRNTSKSKQSVTRETKEVVKEIEEKIKQARKEYGPLEPSVEPESSENGFDVVLHRSDDHFGDVVEREGEVIFDSKMTEERCVDSFDKAISTAKRREGSVDSFHLLLGGDIVTNEKVFPHQPFEIDLTIDEQLDKAAKVYFSQIERLSEEFPFVQVVCQHGNHGALQQKGMSNHANVDDMLYNQLEMACSVAGLENVRFVKSDDTGYTNFSMRGWRGHLRHGDNVNTHIGTSSPQSTWLNYLNNHDFDIAYRGHYHEHKIEHVSGRPVIMAPAFKPCGDYEEMMGIFGEPMSYVHGVNDETPLAWSEYIHY